MSIELLVAVVCLVLQCTLFATTWIVGGASTWRRLRWFAAVSASGASYSLVDTVGAWLMLSGQGNNWTMTASLLLASVHAAAWLIFAYADKQGSWDTLPVAVRLATVGSVGLLAILIATGAIRNLHPAAPVFISSLGVSVNHSKLNRLGEFAIVIPVGLLLASGWGFLVRARRGERHAKAILAGFALFFVFAFEEAAVALGWLNFVYLGNLGYVAVVAPVAWYLLSSLRDDAERLDRLTFHLTDEVNRRTEERDQARRELLEQRRLAALGRIAAGVGHEVNNPLQYLQLSLEELRDNRALCADLGARVALDHAFEGAERIRQVVDGLRTYARPGEGEAAELDVRDAVNTAIRIAAPHWRRGVTVKTGFGDVPPVKLNERRMVEAILNPLVNGIQAMLEAGDASRMTLTVAADACREGGAEVTISDQGPGFAGRVFDQLGEPYVTTRAASGGTGLGLFVTRGILESCGGTIRFKNRPDGGAQVTMCFPSSGG